MSGPRLFCFGLGYTAQALARRARDLGWQVAGTARPGPRLDALRAAGWEVHPFGPDAPLPASALAGATHVLSSAPPAAGQDPVLGAHADDLRRLAREGLRWAGYLSATSVYGDHHGAWVAAGRSACRPSGPRGRERLAAEEGWRALAGEGSPVPVHVFRLAGLYGPGRSALDRVRAGDARRVVKPGLVFSRVHVEDAAAALLLSALAPRPGAIYDLADDEPAPPQDVTAFACALLGVEPPPLEPWDPARLSPPLREFYADSKRVESWRARVELGWRPEWPDYRAGLRALLAAGA